MRDQIAEPERRGTVQTEESRNHQSEAVEVSGMKIIRSSIRRTVLEIPEYPDPNRWHKGHFSKISKLKLEI
jgi:hypothetical protein